jgi:hypothetical protein
MYSNPLFGGLKNEEFMIKNIFFIISSLFDDFSTLTTE